MSFKLQLAQRIMTKEEILLQVQSLFRRVLSQPALEIMPSSSSKTVKNWDSLNHILLVVEIEKHFKIRFNTAELARFKDVGEMCERISVMID